MMMVALVACKNEQPPATESSSEQSSESSSSKETPGKDETSSKEPEVDDSKFPPVDRIDYNVSIAQTIDTSIFGKINDFKNDFLEQTYHYTSLDITGAGKVEIETAGIYKISGKTTKGYILVDIKKEDPLKEVVLILDNVEVTSSSETASIPPIYSEGCNLTIVLPDGTVNNLTDTVTNAEKGAIYVKTGNLTIEGRGTLNVTGVSKNAIVNTKKLTVNGGILNLTAVNSGLYGEDYGVEINDGEINITSEKAGIKAGDYEKGENPGDPPLKDVVAPLVINGGRIDIKSKEDGIRVNGDATIASCGLSIITDTNGIDVTGNLTFNTVTDKADAIVDISSIKRGIKCDGKVSILGGANLKIDVRVSEEEAESTTDEFNYNKDCIKAYDVLIDTTGVVYLKTNETYKADKSYQTNPSGSYYILDSREYVKVDPSLYSGKIIFSIDGSNRGIEAFDKIEIKNGIIAIDSAEDSLNAGGTTKDDKGNILDKKDGSITISGGTINIVTSEDAISCNGTVAVSGSTQLNILDANKGIKAPSVTIDDGKLVIITLSDTIDADEITVNDGDIFLLEKVDIEKEVDGEEDPEIGDFIVNGGKIVCLSTTNLPKEPTSSDVPVFAVSIEDESQYVYGNFIQINVAGLDEIVIKIPKSYAKKLSIVIVSDEIESGESTISVGSYEGGIPKNLICTGGTFTAIKTETFEK